MNNIVIGSREINNQWDYYETIGAAQGINLGGMDLAREVRFL